ncbi:MAG TPA: 6-phospho-3-hexuloisomerase [Desulfurococcaceae archaeon]|nr:6-phospho-3-hexuloisomerase [Desulfurococcaceae archaeon]
MVENVYKAMYVIADFIINATKELKREQVERMINKLVEAYERRDHKILVMGAGRSGLVGRAFAMRLLHLGYNVYVLGDTIVPRIGKGDIVIAISGSGRTKLIVTAAEAAKHVGATVIAVTSYPDSPLAEIADIVVEVPGRTKIAREEDYFARQILGIHEPLAPLGTLFEDTAMVFLDAVVAEQMERLGKTEEDLKAIHANIEI